MITAPIPPKESERLKSLKEHKLLDTLPEEVYDDITRIASEICGTPIALLTLIDENRLWIKSKQGVELTEVPREFSFCAHAINNPDEAFIVPDARFDERFHDNPSITGEPYLAFYAGVPVKGADGQAFGSLCVMDNRPRDLPEHKLESLKALAKLVNAHFELRKTRIDLEESRNKFTLAQEMANTLEKEVKSLVQGDLPDQNQRLIQLQESADALNAFLKKE
jgi:GAF domain-containing protein